MQQVTIKGKETVDREIKVLGKRRARETEIDITTIDRIKNPTILVLYFTTTVYTYTLM